MSREAPRVDIIASYAITRSTIASTPTNTPSNDTLIRSSRKIYGHIPLRGQVPFPTDGSDKYDSIGCNNWWTDARSEVRRSIFMDDYVYAISNDTLKVAHLDDLGTEIASIPIGD